MSKKKYIHGSSEPEKERLAKLNYLTNESFIHFLNVKSTDKILELGSGLGILASQISKSLIKGKLTGIELSLTQIKSCPRSNKNLEFIRGDVHNIPFPDSSFHKIYCRYILEHLSNPEQALKEAIRVLKPAGEISIQENSILLIEFYPECPKFLKVWKKFAALQVKLGGDAMIGLKLHSLLLKAGFRNVQLSMAPEIHWYGKNSFDPWIVNLIKNIEGASHELITNKLTTKIDINNAITELEKFRLYPFASTYFYWNRAKALR
jgi:ubiquinone/menaquinone biosynthesis C-methylase UbiE